MTVWLSLCPESYKVELTLGSASLDVGGGGIGSGGRGFGPLDDEPWA